MANNFDNERRRKAFIYTAAICTLFLISFFIISWKDIPPAPPVVQELIEINLGNDDEGLGDVQPLIKGEMSPEETTPEPPAPQPPAPQQNEPIDDNITPVDNAPEDAAPVAKPVNKPTPKKEIVTTPTPVVKTVTKPTANPTPIVPPTPKPRIPKVTYNGPGNGGGNGATEDNGYTMQGNKPGGKGDKGVPNGNKDSYGDKVGTGKTGGPRVISGNIKIINRVYNFTDELEKATINAVIKVGTDGVGTFIRIGQGSTSTNVAYANAIKRYLQSMKFTPVAEESTGTVQFNFNIQ
jgi:outer membrane biosynthesis protein TonB